MDGEKRLSLTEYERLTRPTEPRLSLEELKRAIEENGELLALLVHIVKLCVRRETIPIHRVVRHAIRQENKEAQDRYRDSIPNAITNLRILRNEAQWEMAPLLGVHQSTLTRFEKGTRKPNQDVLLKLVQLAKDTPGGAYLSSAFDLKCENLEP